MVSHVVYVAVDTVGVSVSVRPANDSILVALLLPVLAVSTVVLSPEIESERLCLAEGRSAVLLLLLDVLFVLLLVLLLLLLLNERRWSRRCCCGCGACRLVPVGLGCLIVGRF